MSSLSLFLLKIVFSATMVIGITMAAEKGSPRLAGVFMGFPLGTGLTLFFIGIEQGPQYAAESAIWATPGVLTSLAFFLGYSIASQSCNLPKYQSIIASTISGLICYIICAVILLYIIPHTLIARTIILCLGIPLFALLFQFPAKNTGKPHVKKTAGILVLITRVVFASAGIIVITGVTQNVGAAWSGIFSTFPTAILPSLMILHYANGSTLIPHLFRETAFGVVAIIIFSITISITFPALGVSWGILISYFVSFIYLLLYELYLRPYTHRSLTLFTGANCDDENKPS